ERGRRVVGPRADRGPLSTLASIGACKSRCPSVPSRPWPSLFFFPLFFSVELSPRSEEHTSELQSRENLVCRLLLEKKKKSKLYENNSSTHNRYTQVLTNTQGTQQT